MSDEETPTVAEVEPTDEEVAALEDEDGPKRGRGVPPWATLPPGFKVPPGGARATFMRFKAEWTDRPEKGDRWCMVWPLTEQDEKLAMARAAGDANQAVHELTRQTIRIVDGHKADWTGSPNAGSVRQFWRDIGKRCRNLLIINYHRTHNLSPEELADFAVNGTFEAALVPET